MNRIHISKLVMLLIPMSWFFLSTIAIGADMGQSSERIGRGPPPTLREAVEAAFTRHPQQQALAARAGEVDALTLRADSLIAGNPALEASYKTDQAGSGDGFREWEAGVSVPLWQPGQRDAQRVVAERSATALADGKHALKLAVAGEVRERMWAAALMRNNLELAKKQWDTALALEHNVQRRVELGELANTDLLLARDTTLTKQGAYLRAQAEFHHALKRYQSFTGLERLPRRRGESRAETSTVSEDHPQLAEATADLRQMHAKLMAVRRARGGAPQLFLGGSGERGNSDDDFNNRLGATLSLPIGTQAHTNPAVAVAELARAEAQADHDNSRRQLTLALTHAIHELESAETELKLAQERRQLARENLRLTQVAFDAGETDLVGLLRVQGLAFAAERREGELRITRQRAIARYNQAVGILP